MTSEFNEDELERRVRAHLTGNMDKALAFLKGEVQRSINRGNASGEDPSAPGEPPKKVSGRLFQSIATAREDEPRAIVGKVGTNVEYARRLELGFSGTDAAGRNISQAPRPFLRPSLKDNLTAIGRFLSRA